MCRRKKQEGSSDELDVNDHEKQQSEEDCSKFSGDGIHSLE